ncbi:MAG: hypothetical protein ABEJ36_01815 [Candidatus Nanosalina sp.]
MVTLDQGTWNTLFGWLGQGQCMLPEGCNVPIEGVIAYIAIIIALLAVLNWRNKLRRKLEELLDRAEQEL